MKPLFALLPSGSYVALHLCHYFCVMPSDNDETPGAWDVIATRPGEEDMTVLCTVEGYGERCELVARQFLQGLILSMAKADRLGGILDVAGVLQKSFRDTEAGNAFTDDATAILEREA